MSHLGSTSPERKRSRRESSFNRVRREVLVSNSPGRTSILSGREAPPSEARHLALEGETSILSGLEARSHRAKGFSPGIRRRKISRPGGPLASIGNTPGRSLRLIEPKNGWTFAYGLSARDVFSDQDSRAKAFRSVRPAPRAERSWSNGSRKPAEFIFPAF